MKTKDLPGEINAIPQKARACMKAHQKSHFSRAPKLVGMGSSYYAAHTATLASGRGAGLAAHEFDFSRPLRLNGPALISQSGRSGEALAAANRSLHFTAITLAYGLGISQPFHIGGKITDGHG